ncbi:TPA: hypothetical protein ACH3X1_011497 [Trebouxia sp. C0004]
MATSWPSCKPYTPDTMPDISAADLRPHKKLKVVCWQRLLHLQERQIEKTDQLLVKMDKLVALSSLAAGQNKSAAYSKEQKNNLVKMVNDFMDRHMVSKGFYPSMPDYQACVLHVLGKENLPAAKQNLKEYLAIIEMASCYVDWTQC